MAFRWGGYSGSSIFESGKRGKAEKDFEALSTDPGRKIILLMDASGLKATFSPASSTPPLERIGYTRGYIEELRSFGQKFKVALLRPKGLVARATWDNLLLFLVEAYGVGHPVVQAFKVHLPALKQYSFVQILQKFGRGINPAINSNTMPPQGNLLEVRSFLYNELRLTDLFTGDGYTRTPDGGLGIAEYFFLNREFKKMYRHEYEIADIHF